MKIRERNFPFAFRTAHAHDCIERGQCHAHIARMSGNALLALAEDGVNSIVTVNRTAAACPDSVYCTLGTPDRRNNSIEFAAKDCHRPWPCCAIADLHQTAALHSKPDSAI